MQTYMSLNSINLKIKSKYSNIVYVFIHDQAFAHLSKIIYFILPFASFLVMLRNCTQSVVSCFSDSLDQVLYSTSLLSFLQLTTQNFLHKSQTTVTAYSRNHLLSHHTLFSHLFMPMSSACELPTSTG